MSSPVRQPIPQPSWKEEVNRRLAAHKSRAGMTVVQTPAHPSHAALNSRAAAAAARVAERYAKAPTYSEMQAAEARAALRTAEEATLAALEAQAAAHSALDRLETAVEQQTAREEQEVVREIAARRAQQVAEVAPEEPLAALPSAPVAEPLPPPAPQVPAVDLSTIDPSSVAIRWEPDMPARPAEPAQARASRAVSTDQAGDWFAQPVSYNVAAAQAVEHVDDAELIPANLIQFPRELIATRRMRPRLAGTHRTALGESQAQLSIFEVDPETVSIDPEPAPQTESEETLLQSGAEWSGIELGAHPSEAILPHAEPEAAGAAEVHQAPIGWRALAAALDLVLIVGLVAAGAAAVLARASQLPSLKSAEMGLGLALMVGAALYQAAFLFLQKGTPGMRYAHIALCTFDDENPTAAQLRHRFLAMALSIFPVGIGIAWAIFDDNHLTWHDRLSRTYLRRY